MSKSNISLIRGRAERRARSRKNCRLGIATKYAVLLFLVPFCATHTDASARPKKPSKWSVRPKNTNVQMDWEKGRIDLSGGLLGSGGVGRRLRTGVGSGVWRRWGSGDVCEVPVDGELVWSLRRCGRCSGCGRCGGVPHFQPTIFNLRLRDTCSERLIRSRCFIISFTSISFLCYANDVRKLSSYSPVRHLFQ